MRLVRSVLVSFYCRLLHEVFRVVQLLVEHVRYLVLHLHNCFHHCEFRSGSPLLVLCEILFHRLELLFEQDVLFLQTLALLRVVFLEVLERARHVCYLLREQAGERRVHVCELVR